MLSLVSQYTNPAAITARNGLLIPGVTKGAPSSSSSVIGSGKSVWDGVGSLLVFCSTMRRRDKR